MKKQPPATHFLNVDLELTASFDLQPLADAFEAQSKMSALYVGRRGARTYFANLELNIYRRNWNPDLAIHEQCKCILALPPSARKLWKQAKTRDFSIGIAAGRSDATFVVAADTVKAAARVGAGISIVVYQPEEFRQKLRDVRVRSDK